MKKPNRDHSNSQVPGFIIAVSIIGIGYFFFYDNQKTSQNQTVSNASTLSEQQSTDQTNGLIEAQNMAQKRQEEQRLASQPFVQKSILNFPDDGRERGNLKFKTNKHDTVFVVRDKHNHNIVAVLQLPKHSESEIKAPLGEYTIEYATGDGNWLGLDKLWNYSTQYYRSNSEHFVRKEYTTNDDYRILSRGLIVDVVEGVRPERMNHQEFIKAH